MTDNYLENAQWAMAVYMANKLLSEAFGDEIAKAGGSKSEYEKIRRQKQAQGDQEPEAPKKTDAQRAAQVARNQAGGSSKVTAGTERLRGKGARKAPMSIKKINRSRANQASISAKTQANEKAFGELVSRLAGVKRKKS